MASDNQDDELNSTYLIAIVVGSTGFVLMVLGGVYYLTRMGDVPSRKAVANVEDAESEGQPKDKGSSTAPAGGQIQSSSPAGVAAPASPAISMGSDAQDSVSDTPKEELIEIYAPAGKLGVVLDTPGDGPPTVHEIRPSSVLKDELQVGDRVIALDDEDVRMMSANKVSRIISRKMENSTRKFSIIRTIVPDESEV